MSAAVVTPVPDQYTEELSQMNWHVVDTIPRVCKSVIGKMLLDGQHRLYVVPRIMSAIQGACLEATDEPLSDAAKTKADVTKWFNQCQEIFQVVGGGDFAKSPVGLGERLIADNPGDLHYVTPWKEWTVWNGQIHERDYGGHLVYRRMVDTVRNIYRKASDALTPEQRMALGKYALSAEREIKKGVDAASNLKGVSVIKPDQHFDIDLKLLGVSNGTVDLRSGRLRQPHREDLVTKQAPVVYDESAQCPVWRRVFADNLPVEDIRWLQKAFGYALTGEYTEPIFTILYGPRGRNGKTLILETMKELLGPYAATVNVNTFLEKNFQGDGPNPALVALSGSRFAIMTEAAKNRKLNISLVKAVTGGDIISERDLYKGPRDILPTFKPFMRTNDKPLIEDIGDAIWARLKLILFEITWIGREDKSLRDQFRKELSGILNWCIEGCLAWQSEGLKDTSRMTREMNGYRGEMFWIMEFVTPCLVIEPHGVINGDDLWSVYKQWCSKTGHTDRIQRQVYPELRKLGLKDKYSGATLKWRGASLKPEFQKKDIPDNVWDIVNGDA